MDRNVPTVKLICRPDRLSVLACMCFRQDPVALMADIEAMFHQTRVVPEDTDALRFLWSDGDLQKLPEEYKMLVHIFGTKSSPCCANRALKETANDNEGNTVNLCQMYFDGASTWTTF